MFQRMREKGVTLRVTQMVLFCQKTKVYGKIGVLLPAFAKEVGVLTETITSD